MREGGRHQRVTEVERVRVGEGGYGHTLYATPRGQIRSFARYGSFLFIYFFYDMSLSRRENNQQPSWTERKENVSFPDKKKTINTLNIINKLVSTPASDCKNEWKAK